MSIGRSIPIQEDVMHRGLVDVKQLIMQWQKAVIEKTTSTA